jgi:hypothetical protein
MSYDPNPEWADINIDELLNCVCPTCKKQPKRFIENLKQGPIFEADYYYPRHIPKDIELTCNNPKCKDCDKTFYFSIDVKISPIAVYFK